MRRRTTLRDVATAAGVSAVTVHKALYSKSGVAPETRKKILGLVDAMDYSVNEAASSLKRRALHIAVILQNIENPDNQNFFFRKMWQGIDRAATQLNDYRVRITRIECGETWESQEEILLGLAKRKDVDGAILHCWDETKLNPAIDYLHEKGIPIVTVNSDAIGSKRIACVSADNEQTGMLAAEVLSRFIQKNGRPKVLIAGGNKMVENLRSNRLGFQSYMKNALHGAPVQEIYNFGDKDKFRDDLRATLSAGDNIAGIHAITSRDTFNTCEVVRELGLSGRIAVVGSDAFTELIGFFDDGTLYASVWKDELAQAERAALLLYQHLTDRPISIERIRIGIVMRNNIEDYL